MVANGYTQRRFSPGSMGVALAINGGLITALVLLGSQAVRPRPDDSIIARHIPLPSPPRIPEQPKPKPRADVQPAPRLSYQPRPIPDIPVDRPTFESADSMAAEPATTLPGRMSGAGVGTGTDTGVVVDPPKPAPVLVDAAPDARYLDDFQPPYPPSERRAERDGVVTVRVQVGANGRVLAIEPVRATSDAFFEATRRQALSRWRFRPATRDGVPVETTRVMTVRFEMEQ